MAATLGSILRPAGRECRLLLSSPWELALATWLPWLLMIILAVLLRQGLPRDLPVAVVDEDRSPRSHDLIRRIDAAPAVAAVSYPSLPAAWKAARALDVYGVVYIPPKANAVFVFNNAGYRTAGTSVANDVQGAVASAQVSPIAVQTTTPSNPSRSYELFLLSVLLPAILHYALCLSVATAFGRELRDGTADGSLREAGGRPTAVIFGKLIPYVLLFSLWGYLSVVWLASLGTGRIEGSLTVLLAGHILMILAYAAIALLFVGATRNLGKALSFATLYAGASVAYSSMTFPSEGASWFVRVWSALLPYTAYLRLQAQQLLMRAAPGDSLLPILILMSFVIVPGSLGAYLYAKALRDPKAWGAR